MSNLAKHAHHFDPDEPPVVSDEPLCPLQMMDINSAQGQLGLTDDELDEAIRRLTRGRLAGFAGLGAVDGDLLLSRMRAAGAV